MNRTIPGLYLYSVLTRGPVELLSRFCVVVTDPSLVNCLETAGSPKHSSLDVP